MPNLELEAGPHDFDETTIKRYVAEEKIGNFALGYLKWETGGFVPKFVGRSDADLRAELLAKLETRSKKRQKFVFGYAQSVKGAFDKECKNYHAFKKQLEGEIHPRRATGTDYPCPVTGCIELE